MTIKELIEKLSTFNQDMEVIISDGYQFDVSYHLNGAVFEALDYEHYGRNTNENKNILKHFLDIGVGGNRLK